MRIVFRQVLCGAKVSLLLLPLLGCEHGTPFAAGSYGSSQPFAGGSPQRLTYNAGQDRAPAWLPDESGLIYSLERTDRADRDRCLGVLPPDGGQLRSEICNRNPAAADSTDVLMDAAGDAQGRLAYVAASSLVGALTPASSGLVLSTLADPAAPRVLVTFPYFATDTVPHGGAAQIRWLGPAAIVYLAQRIGIEGHCKGCPLDTVRTGVAIDRLDLSATPQVSVLPGTRFASSVAVGATPDVVIYTLDGDSRVYRRTLSSGMDSTLFDFGAGGIARDVQLIGSRLVAVVGGRVSFGFDATLGFEVQRDSGGPVHVVDLATARDSVLDPPDAVFRRPALSPSGRRLVVEAYPCVAPSGGGACRVLPTSDLWEFSLP